MGLAIVGQLRGAALAVALHKVVACERVQGAALARMRQQRASHKLPGDHGWVGWHFCMRLSSPTRARRSSSFRSLVAGVAAGAARGGLGVGQTLFATATRHILQLAPVSSIAVRQQTWSGRASTASPSRARNALARTHRHRRRRGRRTRCGREGRSWRWRELWRRRRRRGRQRCADTADLCVDLVEGRAVCVCRVRPALAVGLRKGREVGLGGGGGGGSEGRGVWRQSRGRGLS